MTGSLLRGQATHHASETPPQGNGNEAPHDNANGNGVIRKALRRQRHYAWIKAHSLTRQWFTKELIDDEIRFARAYVESVDKYYLLFLCFDCDGKMHPLAKPYVHRLSKAYGRLIEKRLRKYIYPVLMQYRQFVHIILTIDPKQFTSQYEAYRSTMKTWNSLLTRLRRRFPWITVIRTGEWQENGIGFHIHAVVGGLIYIRKDWIMETWNVLTKSGWGVEIRPVRGDAEYVIRYIMKYILKGFGDGVDNLSAVLNWAVNARAYGVSLPRNVRKRLLRIREIERIEHRAHVTMMCPCGVSYLGKIESLYVETRVAYDIHWIMDYFKLYERGLPKGPPIPE